MLITGASSGIGRAAALRIGKAGATTLLVSRRRDRLEATASEIAQRGGVAGVYVCDLSEPEDIDRMAAEVLEQHGCVDVLVNNAGRSIRRPVSASYARFHDFQRTMQLNYFGALRLILDLLPAMRERGDGHIVNVSTAGVQSSAPQFAAYLASKAALDAFSRSLGFEVASDGVRITTVYMPLVRTPMITPTRMYDRWPALTPEQAAELIMKAVCARPSRVAPAWGTLSEIAHAVAPQLDHAVSGLLMRLRLGRHWRTALDDGGANAQQAAADPEWREAFRRRLETSRLPSDPDEVRRLVTLLKTMPLFASCPSAVLYRLASTAYPIVFDEGDVVCHEGAVAAECYVIVEGEVEVTVHGQHVGAVRSGDVVGERGPIENRARTASVVAASRLLTYAISRERLNEVLEAHPETAARMRDLVRARYGAVAESGPVAGGVAQDLTDVGQPAAPADTGLHAVGKHHRRNVLDVVELDA